MILPRLRRNLRPARAWRWLLIVLLVLLVMPLPARHVPRPSRPAAYVARGFAAAIAVRYALDQLGKPTGGAATAPPATTAPA
jgi:hypothetical protein